MTNELYFKVQSLLFDTRRSWRYHEWRVKFFRRFSNWRLVLASLSTSATFAMLLKLGAADVWVTVFAGVSAVLVAMDLAIRFADRERQHESLLRHYKALERDIVIKGAGLAEPDYDAFQGRYLEIEMEEPPILHTLNDLCHNAEIRARFPRSEWGKHLVDVGWLQRLMASAYDLMPHTHASYASCRPRPSGVS